MHAAPSGARASWPYGLKFPSQPFVGWKTAHIIDNYLSIVKYPYQHFLHLSAFA